MPHCIVKNKEVSFKIIKDIKDGTGKIVQVFFECSGSYIDTAGLHIKSKCDMEGSEKCILKLHGKEMENASIEALNKQNK